MGRCLVLPLEGLLPRLQCPVPSAPLEVTQGGHLQDLDQWGQHSAHVYLGPFRSASSPISSHPCPTPSCCLSRESAGSLALSAHRVDPLPWVHGGGCVWTERAWMRFAAWDGSFLTSYDNWSQDTVLTDQ